MLGEAFVEGAADVGLWATCTKRSMISCAISAKHPDAPAHLIGKSPDLRSKLSASMLNWSSHSPPRDNNDISCVGVILVVGMFETGAEEAVQMKSIVQRDRNILTPRCEVGTLAVRVFCRRRQQVATRISSATSRLEQKVV